MLAGGNIECSGACSVQLEIASVERRDTSMLVEDSTDFSGGCLVLSWHTISTALTGDINTAER